MNHLIKFAVTKEQFQKVKELALSYQQTVSDFARQKILKPSYGMEKMIIEIYRKMMNDGA